MFKRIDDTTEIDTDFITCAEYQLFLDEMRAQKKYRQPDHWTAYTFFETTPRLSATGPVLGVCAEDVEVFVIWLNGREKATYRLPTPAEAKEFPATVENVATWCYEDKQFMLEGVSESEYQWIEHRLKNLSTLPLLNHLGNLFLSYPNFYLDPARAFDCSHTCFLDLARSRSLTCSLTRSLDLTLSLALDLTLARTFAHTFALHLTRTFELAQTFALAQTFDYFSSTLAYSAIDDKKLYTLLSKRRFNVALQRIKQLQDEDALLSSTQQRKLILLTDLINCQTATTILGIRQTFRKYVVHLLEYAWIGLNELEKEKLEKEKKEEIVIHQWWQFWKRHSPKVKKTNYLEKTDYLEKEQRILENYWQLKIIEARADGELPAWEGIRLVRVTAEK